MSRPPHANPYRPGPVTEEADLTPCTMCLRHVDADDLDMDGRCGTCQRLVARILDPAAAYRTDTDEEDRLWLAGDRLDPDPPETEARRRHPSSRSCCTGCGAVTLDPLGGQCDICRDPVTVQEWPHNQGGYR